MDNSTRWFTAAVAAGPVLAMAAAAVLLVWHEEAIEAVGTEGYKTLLQFLLVVVLGGGVSLLYQWFNRQGERHTERIREAEERVTVMRETRQRYLGELIGIYNQVKRSRRLLRARALIRAGDGDARVRVATYDEHLQHLLDAQLSLEMIIRTARAEGAVFDGETELLPSLRIAEEYIRELISEYETVRPGIADGTGVIPAPSQFADLIGPYEGSPFQSRFIRPAQTAMSAIERLIVARSR